jgi:choline-sulfatase
LTDLAGADAPIDVDGRSLTALLENGDEDGPERVAVSEYHGEGVTDSSFMIRKGRCKYTTVHEHESQLFDLKSDPRESVNLAGRPQHREIEADLHHEIVRRFDGDRIAEDVVRSQTERLLIRDAMKQGRQTSWDHQPFFDAAKIYVR